MSERILENLKKELGNKLVTEVSPPQGIRTGWSQLDHFLLWQGFPKGAVSLLVSESGGASSLWIKSAAQVTQKGQWAAWMNDQTTSLTPWSLKRNGVDLSKLLYVSPAPDMRQWLWAMQELMSLSLFELIGCNLGNLKPKNHHILKLKRMAMRYQTALVLFTHDTQVPLSSFYSLILHFQKHHVCVSRALHRPTPHNLERRDLYADTLPQLAAGRRALCG